MWYRWLARRSRPRRTHISRRPARSTRANCTQTVPVSPRSAVRRQVHSEPRVSSWHPDATPNQTSRRSQPQTEVRRVAPYFNPKYAYVQQYNLDVQRQLPWGIFADVAYAGSHGVNLAQYSTNINQIPDSFRRAGGGSTGSGATDRNRPTNPQSVERSTNATISAPLITAGQLDRPFPQYNGLSLAGQVDTAARTIRWQATVTKRFKDGGTFLAAYTNEKLLTNTDTLTSWLEGSTGGVGQVQDYNNLKGERSLSSQDVSQRLVVSYVYDLPFGHGQRYMGDASGALNKVVRDGASMESQHSRKAFR